MNHFEGYTDPVVGGYRAMVRFAENGKAEPVKCAGGAPEIFPTELEAQKAVTASLLAYFNGHLERWGEKVSAARVTADRIFRKGRVIAVERVTPP